MKNSKADIVPESKLHKLPWLMRVGVEAARLHSAARPKVGTHSSVTCFDLLTPSAGQPLLDGLGEGNMIAVGVGDHDGPDPIT